MFAENTGILNGQIRAGFGGFIGFDAPAALDLLEARGMNRQIAALFLPYWEAGFADGLAEKRKSEKGEGET